ncbi:MAG: formylglycine-generating enzyme family protein [Glaciecola sp.]|nr:formylglycine-generating enzyme family protein [Glaciecola sp.]
MTKTRLSLIFLLGIGTALVAYIGLKNQTTSVHSATKCNTSTGMAFIQGGTFDMGAGAVYPEESPIHNRVVEDFYISRTEVTNAEFAEFVDATGYITLAERAIDASLYPNLPAEALVPGSAVFVKLEKAVAATTFLNWWHFIEGANWRHPIGPDSNIIGKEHFPVVHIAYDDAKAYADWKGHRLPTEAEFEYASRSGLNGAKYATGDSLTTNGQYHGNTWQGLFPFNDNGDDGFIGLAPVACYDANTYGVHDLIGNVWEWTDSTYYPNHFPRDKIPNSLPKSGYDPNQPNVPVGVIKGGSYLCADDFCMRYRPAARRAQDTGLGTTHIGFRTAKSVGS